MARIAFGGGGGSGGGYGGGGPFGTRVAPIAMPNPFGDLSSVYPNLPSTNAAVSGDIQNRLHGNISPDTVNALHNAAATFGVQSGMPGWNAGNLTEGNYLGNIAGARENLIGQGIQEYNQTLPTVSRTQTVDPGLQSEVNYSNAVNAAAPDPAAAASYAKSLFDQYLNAFKGPSGGTGMFQHQPEQLPSYAQSYGGSGTSQADDFMNRPWEPNNPQMGGYGTGGSGNVLDPASPGQSNNFWNPSNPTNLYDFGTTWDYAGAGIA